MKKNKSKCICIIPARGGSKSIPNKNIKLLNGVPLIFYTINNAIKSKIFDKIVVTSDSPKILKTVSIFKEVDLVKRPANLAKDKSLTEPALLHVCEELRIKYNYVPMYVFTLEPTSPLRSISTIKKCFKLINKKNIDSVFGVAETTKCYGKIKDKKFNNLIKNQSRRRQEREKLYFESGTIYATKIRTLYKYSSVIGGSCFPLVVPELESFDINSKLDFDLVESIIKKNK